MDPRPQEAPELPLGAPQDVLDALVGLLPPYYVMARQRGISWGMVPSLAVGVLRDALAKGYTIDRSNEDGPLEAWDGWLFVDAPDGGIFLQTDPAQRHKLA